MTSSVAIVHDSLAVRGGAERVVLALANAHPGAPIYTSVYAPDQTHAGFADLDIRTGALDRFSGFRRDHRKSLPFLSAMYRSTVIDADLVICSSAGFAHHVRTTGRKVVYCHTPARWLYDSTRYLAEWGSPVRVAAACLRRVLAPVDQRAMSEADDIIANSHHVAAEIAAVYGRPAVVIAPCSTLELGGPAAPIEGAQPGFVLSVSRALGYKRLDLLVEAAKRMPNQTFLHLGGGPHRRTLLADAPPNLLSRASVSDDELRWAYQNARCVAITCAEDFGLVPLEAHAHGLTSVAPQARGLLDHIGPETGGRFYEYGSVESLVDALMDTSAPSDRSIRAERLGEKRFIDEMSDHLMGVAV